MITADWQRRLLCSTVAFVFGHLLMGTNPLRAQGDCKVVLEAANKTQTNATHTYSTMNVAGTTQAVEIIYLPGVMYTRMNGKWSRSPMTAQELAEMRRPKAHTDTETCKYLRDEPVNGEMTALYSAHEVSGKGAVDSQVWISKAKGYLMRQEMDIDTGGTGGKSHMSMRFEYLDVKAPM